MLKDVCLVLKAKPAAGSFLLALDSHILAKNLSHTSDALAERTQGLLFPGLGLTALNMQGLREEVFLVDVGIVG